ncbi:MAG: DUF2971 domain-containing protein [Akkermansiaceae bacterium]|nr:DUF2971 domain-containing protein [Akkermansiaceae bacterium]
MKIYKYRSDEYEHLTDLLKSSEFHFSAWDKMNDPMEGYFRYYDHEHTKDRLLQIVNEKRKIKICCFSMVPDDMLLWSHYANNHKGVCIEVDLDLDESSGVTFEPIRYKDDIQFIKKPDRSMRAVKDILSFKLSPWTYEREIRAFTSSNQPKCLKVGKITRVILGFNATQATQDTIRNMNLDCKISKAEFDFDASEISV